MTKILVLLIGLAAAGVTQAQVKCWTSADGKRACGDTPPPGAVVRNVGRAAASPPPAAPAAVAAKSGASTDARKKGPPTAAERGQELRKRQAEEESAAAKAALEKKHAVAVRRKTCDRGREALRTLESGQQIERTDWKGDRYILNDAQRAQETAKARRLAQQSCG